MRHMIGRDVVEEVRADYTKVAIHSCRSATEESPRFVTVLGNGGVCMMKVRDHHYDEMSWETIMRGSGMGDGPIHTNPVIYPTPRDDVDPEEFFEGTKGKAQLV